MFSKSCRDPQPRGCKLVRWDWWFGRICSSLTGASQNLKGASQFGRIKELYVILKSSEIRSPWMTLSEKHEPMTSFCSHFTLRWRQSFYWLLIWSQRGLPHQSAFPLIVTGRASELRGNSERCWGIWAHTWGYSISPFLKREFWLFPGTLTCPLNSMCVRETVRSWITTCIPLCRCPFSLE